MSSSFKPGMTLAERTPRESHFLPSLCFDAFFGILMPSLSPRVWTLWLTAHLQPCLYLSIYLVSLTSDFLRVCSGSLVPYLLSRGLTLWLNGHLQQCLSLNIHLGSLTWLISSGPWCLLILGLDTLANWISTAMTLSKHIPLESHILLSSGPWCLLISGLDILANWIPQQCLSLSILVNLTSQFLRILNAFLSRVRTLWLTVSYSTASLWAYSWVSLLNCPGFWCLLSHLGFGLSG